MKTHNPYPIKYNYSKSSLKFGQFGIKIVSFGRLDQLKFNALKRLLTHFLKKIVAGKKSVKIWTPIIFNVTLTKLSTESRMGKGKGSIYTKASFFKPGTILFEISGITDIQMLEVFRFIKKNIPFKVNLVKKFK